jgi:CBS domain containing-hemolysin-like protein
VRGSNPEDLVGVVRVEDALAVPPSERRTSTVSAIVRPTFVVPESKDLLSLISEMRRHQSQLVAVIDEYGGLAGIVTDEDLLEEIVGEIDEGRPGTRVEREPGMVPGWAGEEQVLEETGFTIPPGEGAYETLAGFLLSTLGHIPSVGEVVEVEGWRFEITQLDEHRIAWVRVHRPRSEGTAGRG